MAEYTNFAFMSFGLPANGRWKVRVLNIRGGAGTELLLEDELGPGLTASLQLCQQSMRRHRCYRKQLPQLFQEARKIRQLLVPSGDLILVSIWLSRQQLAVMFLRLLHSDSELYADIVQYVENLRHCQQRCRVSTVFIISPFRWLPSTLSSVYSWSWVDRFFFFAKLTVAPPKSWVMTGFSKRILLYLKTKKN